MVGVGILIKSSILNHFSVAILEEKTEGILWIELIGKKSLQGQHLGICVIFPQLVPVEVIFHKNSGMT